LPIDNVLIIFKKHQHPCTDASLAVNGAVDPMLTGDLDCVKQMHGTDQPPWRAYHPSSGCI